MIYLVNQGRSYRWERSGQFIWSHKLDTAGHKNAGYSLMCSVKKGDYILHNKGGQIAAISIAQTDCYSAPQPIAVKNSTNEYDRDDDGYRVDCKYFDFTHPLLNSDLAVWAKAHPHENSCFRINGALKFRYLCNIDPDDASYIITEALRLESDPAVTAVLSAALNSLAIP